MNKTEFLQQLERLLLDIPKQEREEALDFYKSYFEDAGEENESRVIEELGSPGKVAAIIKADLEDQNKNEYGQYTESGYQDERFRDEQMPWQTVNRQQEQQKQGKFSAYTGAEHRHQKRGISWPLVILLGIIGLLALPFIFGIGGGAIALVVGLVVGIFGLFIGLFFGGIGCIVGGVAGIVHSVMHLLSYPATAIATVGGSLILLALGLLFSLAFSWLVLKLLPAIFRWIVNLIQRFIHKGKRGGK